MDQRMIAVTHASSLAGEALLEKLTDSGYTSESVVLLDDEDNIGRKLALGKSYITLQNQHEFDYTGCALVILLEYDQSLVSKLSGTDAVIVSHLLPAGEASFFAADNEAEINFSYSQQHVRLVSPEVSCLLGILPALHRTNTITQINSVILKTAEMKGRAGVDELAGQTVRLLNSQEITPNLYPQQYAFNMIPEASDELFSRDINDGLGDDGIEAVFQRVNVPVFHGVVIAVQLKFSEATSVNDCLLILNEIDNVVIAKTSASPISDCNQSFSCVINQLEQVPNRTDTIQFWMIADPMRYGLANNYVNIVDILLKSFL